MPVLGTVLLQREGAGAAWSSKEMLAAAPAGRGGRPRPTLAGNPGANLGSRSSAQIKNNKIKDFVRAADSESLEEGG